MKTFRKKLLGKASAKKPLRKASAKAQSAMEYLMTYGWAILIIAVVLAALFQLGVFNPMTFAPKAPPGSCQVFRPNGPYTTQFINLEGVCSGELPQYVAQFNNGTDTYIIRPNGPYAYGTNPFSWSLWIKTTQLNSYLISQNRDKSNYNNEAILQVSNGKIYYWDYGSSSYGIQLSSNEAINDGLWHFVVFVRNGNTGYIYIDGQLNNQITGNVVSIQDAYSFVLGSNYRDNNLFFNGSMANVQIYNTSLSANELQALYLEGIGGAPIDLQHLVGWWPLDGNANDYSGNGNNGQINNVTFVSNWYSSYTPP